VNHDGRTNVPYPTRFHFFHMTVTPSAAFPNIKITLLDTRFLKGTGNTSFVGDAYAFNQDDEAATRFDPEGTRVDGDGNFYISDEYGPYIRKFNRQGHLLARIAVPAKFLLDPWAATERRHQQPGGRRVATPRQQHHRPAGQSRHGGPAITPDGKMLVGMMQNALIQDNGLVVVADNTGAGAPRQQPHPDSGHRDRRDARASTRWTPSTRGAASTTHRHQRSEFLVPARQPHESRGFAPNKADLQDRPEQNGLKDVWTSQVASLPELGGPR
jgi:hypothetical protein